MNPNDLMRYTFKPIGVCEMCNNNTAHNKVLGQRLNKSQSLRPRSKSGISVSVKRCGNCGLVYSDPQPIPHSIQDHYGVPPEEYWAEAYFGLDDSYFLPLINTAKSLINFKKDMRAIDIGSGMGSGVKALDNASFDAYGLEPSETFYKASIKANNFPPDKIKLSSIEEAVYEDNSFDFIFMNAVVEHLYNPAASIAKILQWLKPGGIAYIAVPSSDYLITSLIDLYFKLIGTLYTSHISPMHEPYHLFEFTLASFEAHAKSLNYEIVKHDYDICDIMFFPKILHPMLRRYMRATNTGMDLQVWIRKPL